MAIRRASHDAARPRTSPPAIPAGGDGAPVCLLTVPEVAALLRLTEKGIYAMVAARRIPFVKVSNRVRFERAEVLRWLAESRVPASETDR
jgi:excisionase family DNA binding protein